MSNEKMNPLPKNKAISIRAKLLNIAKKGNREFNAILLQYFQERFLYRISISSYNEMFVLKGALLFLAYGASKMRPTKDIDFLSTVDSKDNYKLVEIVKEVLRLKVNDGVIFFTDNLTTEPIKEGQKYPGMRIKFDGRLATAKKRIQIDIGFGDIVIPDPLKMSFPVLLDLPVPVISVYTRESVIAEKFEAIVQLNYLTSRMKDFYDIHFLLSHFSFEIEILKKAIETTFNHRKTNIEERFVVFEKRFKNDANKQKQWVAFLSRNLLSEENNFAQIVTKIEEFLNPVCVNKATQHSLKWDMNKEIWG